MNKRYFFPLLAALLTLWIPSFAERVDYTINDGWEFRRDDLRSATEGWSTVSVPHTWNADDCDDDTPGYHRGPAWYRRTLHIDASLAEHRICLLFEAVNSHAEVYMNGVQAGSHAGGYTAFAFDVTELVHTGDNLLEVRADNTHNPDIPPLSADYTFFGGIYRDVHLIATGPLHITTTHYASSGVFVSTARLDASEADISVRTLLSNDGTKAARAKVIQRVFDPAGHCIAETSTQVKLPAKADAVPVLQSLRIPEPQCWSPDSPQLYRVETSVADARGVVTDAVANPLGLRTCSFDPNRGFFLNGEPLKLVGTSRHQDYAELGYALGDERHTRDAEQLKRMGANFLRIAHYPQDPAVLAACDRLGLLTSVEIPIVNAVTRNEAFADCCERMMTEMVLQNYNSPSVCIWTYMNEVMLRPPVFADERDKADYLHWVRDIAQRCDATARQLDPARATMLPCHGNLTLYDEAGLLKIPDIIGVNLYQGWYGGRFTDFEKQLDRMHAAYPDKSLFVTEYGADCDVRIRSARPERFDFSVDYAMLYHEHYLPQMLARPFICGAAAWNLNDFYAEPRGDAVPHVNCKGLCTLDRTPKDTYFYYQAMLRHDPIVHICGGDRRFRAGVETATGIATERVRIYANAPQVEVSLDGRTLGRFDVTDCIAEVEIPFHAGENRLEATIRTDDGRTARHLCTTDYRLVPRHFDNSTPFTELNVLLGSTRSFDDPQQETAWIPEQPYEAGGWGYVGGTPWRPKTNRGTQPASNLPIDRTRLDPMFQTQRRGLEAFRADLPDGVYEVTLYFAELSGETVAASAYQLGLTTESEAASERAFDLAINGRCVAHGLDVAAETGRRTPMTRRYRVILKNGEGLCVGFTPVRSETMLSAIRILRLY